MCVLKSYRGKKIGEKLIAHTEKEAKIQGFLGTILSAQNQVVSFYQKLGYQICSESFIDANIEHYLMQKTFDQK